jgi:parvulin-like peptidyl-prolyl isomerase
VRASHILCGAAGADAATKAKAAPRPRAAQAGQGGGDFAALAKAELEGSGSAIQGGDLGYFQPGQMVPPFNDVAFKLAPAA